MGEGELRQRQSHRRDGEGPPRRSPASTPAQSEPAQRDTGASVVDALRLIVGLALLSSLASYFVTNESFTWGYRPQLTRLGPLQAWIRGPIVLTPAELALYNGTDPTLPIYVAVNGTVYDVSAGRDSYYGPGGSYSFFAGRDGARAFVTGCFSPEHVVPDLAGAEEVFLPQTGPVSAAERKAARERVRASVRGWQSFFSKDSNGGKYYAVGSVVYPPDWRDRGQEIGLCDAAVRARPRVPGGDTS